MQTQPFFKDFENACRSIYLSRAKISCALNSFLDMADDEFRTRIKQKISTGFENKAKALCCVRDAIVLSTFSDTFSDKKQVKSYADDLVDREEDYDMRQLRVDLFNQLVIVH